MASLLVGVEYRMSNQCRSYSQVNHISVELNILFCLQQYGEEHNWNNFGEDVAPNKCHLMRYITVSDLSSV